ncbi:MAG TPA: hypothetical protein VL652_34685 [Kutzneria sp.]|jgi:hypothetical protein|nr:hypothetical protein [Kutzneria sp.]
MDVTEIIKSAKRPEKTVELCLRGDLVAAWEDLERKRAAAEQASGDSLAGSGARQYAEQMRALEEQMAQATVVFRLRALPRREYNELYAAHPPRLDADGKPDRLDGAYGYNTLTFWPALVAASLVEPLLDAEVLDTLLQDQLSDAQFDALAGAAIVVNRGEVDVPFSPGASAMLRSSAPE